jgi:Protein of unknown function (DUF3237)
MNGKLASVCAAALVTLFPAAAGPAFAAEQAAAPDPSAAPTLEFVFEETVTLAKGIPVGATALGSRNIIPITGGTFEGPNIRGTIMPGGWDWQLVRADGCVQIKADYMIRTDDGVIINVVNQGVLCRPKDGQPPMPVRTQPVFEPPLGKYEWLGQSAFIGTLVGTSGDAGAGVKIRFYRAK